MSGNKVNYLFKDFPSVSTEDWEKKILQDLKGVDYEKRLVWTSHEGIRIKPYYRAEHLKEFRHFYSLPGEFPYTRGYNKSSNKWDIREDFVVKSPEEDNQKALKALSKGASAIGFITKKNTVKSTGDLQKLLDGIDLEKIPLNFISGTGTIEILSFFEEIIKANKVDATRINGSVNWDPLGNLTKYGDYIINKEKDIDYAVELLKKCGFDYPQFRFISVNGIHFVNSGASAVMELAFSLAKANEYLTLLTKKGLSVDQVAQKIQFNFGSGSNYFMEISKLRAARMLWAKIVEAWQPDDENSLKTFIHTETPDFNKTVYDPYVNMLRTTTEAMASVIGGTNSLCVNPFDNHIRESSDFSERIARNIQIILKNESYFDKVADPSAGSYYIESLTDSIATETWKLFQNIEEAGGYVKALEKGIVQDKIAELRKKRVMNMAQRKEILVGTNQYVDTNESSVQNIPFKNDLEKNVSDQPVVKPLKKIRVAEEFEKLRLDTENFDGKTPEVFLFTYGDKKLRKARATFSSNLFTIAGFKIIDNLGFETIEEGLISVEKKDPEIVVLCSSDEEYPEIANDVYRGLNPGTIPVIAGFPKKSVEMLKKSGYKHFIHVKTDVLKILREFQNELNII